MKRNNSEKQAGTAAPKVFLGAKYLKEADGLLFRLKPYRKLAMAVACVLMVTTCLELSLPLLAGALMDAAMPGAAKWRYSWLPHSVNLVALLMLGVIVVEAVGVYFHSTSVSKTVQDVVADLRRDLYSRLVYLPVPFLNERRVGELNYRLSADLTQIETMLMVVIPQFLRQSLMLAGGVTLIIIASGRLTLIIFLAVLVLLYLGKIAGRKMRQYSRQAQDQLANTGVIVEETLQGILNVKAFTNEAFEIKRYNRAIDLYLQMARRGVRLRGLFIAFAAFALYLSLVLVQWAGASLLQDGRITIGEMTRFILYSSYVAIALSSSSDIYSQIQKTIGATQRVRELLKEPLEFNVTSGAEPSTCHRPLRGEVAFQNVSFRYPSRPEIEVLKDISFAALPGQKIALVGPSGSGKSTIISLLFRFYDPRQGSILLDGRGLSDYPLHWVRSQMSIVPQELLLFGGTILENIAYGRPEAKESEILEAARCAYVHEFVSLFPGGYNTVVGERGVKLSGGQRQRIAIARAILKNPKILVLDEATNALDSENEHLVQLAMNQLMEHRTTFIIAHRLATVHSADRILVIQNGAIVESGTHSELSRRTDGVYRRLTDLQFDCEQTRGRGQTIDCRVIK